MRIVFIAQCPKCEWKHQSEERPVDGEQIECVCCGNLFPPQWQKHEDVEPLKLKPKDTARPNTVTLKPEDVSPSKSPAQVQQAPSKPVATTLHAPTLPQAQPIKVIVTDFDMNIGSMVTFMVKWAIAVIPAAAILFILAGGFVVLLSALSQVSRN